VLATTFVETVLSLKSAAMDGRCWTRRSRSVQPWTTLRRSQRSRTDRKKKSPEGQGEPSGPVESRPGEGPDFLGSTQGGEW